MKPVRPRTANAVASEIFASNKRMENQRHEILNAFMAKWKVHPDLCKQVKRKGEWCIVRMDQEEVKLIRREIIEKMFYSHGPSKWQRLCLWMARLK